MPCLALGDFLLLLTLQASIALFEAAPCMIALEGTGLPRLRCEGQAPDNGQYRVRQQRAHFDTVHRTGCHAEVATGALIDDHRVHQFGRADDGIDRAGLNALGATNALGLADVGELRRGRATADIQLQHRHLQQFGQGINGFVAAGRTFVDRLAIGDAFGVRLAPGVAALAALGLRQECVDALNQTHVLISPLNPRKATAIRPAPIRSIGKPRKGRGTSLSTVRSRKSVNRLNTSQKPNPAPRLRAVA
ncbi:hypothetical protein D3C78_1013400 [compost metagenome]